MHRGARAVDASTTAADSEKREVRNDNPHPTATGPNHTGAETSDDRSPLLPNNLLVCLFLFVHHQECKTVQYRSLFILLDC